ncbi:phosphotransferase enzyme family protein [Streptomyces jeddahensis]|nr:phosphotransferase [Streptomyces jeddahensis]
MPLTEIDRLKQTVSEAWDSPVADQVAAEWGYPAGTARWWRSSASHVFVLPDNGRRRYLRFVPGSYRGPRPVTAVAELMARLSDGGSPVVRPVAAESGALTVTVATGLGAMHAMVVEPAPGEEVDITELSESQAWHWGQALAHVHRDAAGLDAGLPESFGELPAIGELFAHDTALVEATARLADLMSDLPRGQDRWGVVHGDFELDNMAWEDGRPVAYDFDEAALSWYAADIAYAVRDLTDHTGQPTTEHRARFDAFLAGYRSVRPFGDEDVGRLPLFAGLHAATSLVRITRALGEPDQAEPEWLTELRNDMTDMARTHRKLVIDIGQAVGRGIRL